MPMCDIFSPDALEAETERKLIARVSELLVPIFHQQHRPEPAKRYAS